MIDIAAAIVCIAAMTGLPEAPAPAVGIVPAAEWPAGRERALALNGPLVGGTILLRPGAEHLIVHELAHHLQASAGRSIVGAQAEGQAWHVQWRFRFDCPGAAP